jgi:hypothetical protein
MINRLRQLPKKKRANIVSRIFIASWCWMLILFVYGIIRWIYAPIRLVGNKFLDKKGNEFTEETYLDFKLWESTLVISFVTVAIVLLLAHWILEVSLNQKKETPNPKKRIQ